jgi:competence protein ComGC
MKTLHPQQMNKGLTITEVLLTIVLVAVLVFIFLPRNTRTGVTATLVLCHANLRQMEDCFEQFTIDHNNKFPMQVSVTNGGSMELVAKGDVASTFAVLSNYFKSPKILICPADTRKPARSIATLQNKNVSYFVSLDATLPTPGVILAGDRNLQIAGEPIKPGVFILTTNTPVSWTSELHSRQYHRPCGNVLFTDGPDAVGNDWTLYIQRQGLATNRLAIP